PSPLPEYRERGLNYGIAFCRQILLADSAAAAHWGDSGGVRRCALVEAEFALADLDRSGTERAAELRVAVWDARKLGASQSRGSWARGRGPVAGGAQHV